MSRSKGGRLSLTAFEAEWLRMVVDTNFGDAIAAVNYLEIKAPARVKADPSTAWQRIVDKISDVAPIMADDASSSSPQQIGEQAERQGGV